MSTWKLKTENGKRKKNIAVQNNNLTFIKNRILNLIYVFRVSFTIDVVAIPKITTRLYYTVHCIKGSAVKSTTLHGEGSTRRMTFTQQSVFWYRTETTLHYAIHHIQAKNVRKEMKFFTVLKVITADPTSRYEHVHNKAISLNVKCT